MDQLYDVAPIGGGGGGMEGGGRGRKGGGGVGGTAEALTGHSNSGRC